MRDFLIVGILLSVLPFALRYTWVGVLLWNWISLMNPHKLAYGFAKPRLLFFDNKSRPGRFNVPLIIFVHGVFAKPVLPLLPIETASHFPTPRQSIRLAPYYLRYSLQ